TEARKTTIAANSSGVPMRPIGMSAEESSTCLSKVMPLRLARSVWCSLKRSVMIRPGSTRLTVMPWDARSPARVLKRPAMPGRMPLESTRPSTGCFTELDWMARIRPHLACFMCGSTSRMKRTVDRCTCSKAAFHCSSVICSKGPGGGPPTLATRMSTPPKARLASATTLAMSAGRLASAASARTSAPVFCLTSPAASLSAASPRAHITTRAPSAARPSALALPMPLLAATTSAVLPLMPRSIGSLPVRRSGTLLVEVGAVAAGDGQLADLVVAHHFEGHLLARRVAPEREVQLLAGGDLLRVERHDQVALLDARARPGAVGHEAGHHHTFLHRGGEDPEPGALGAA